MTDKLNGDSKMAAAYRVAGKAWREHLRARRPDDVSELDAVSASEIVVVDGHYDRIGRVLEVTGVPYRKVAAQRLNTIDWNALQVLMVNCPGHLPATALRRIPTWVREGGYLLTTDWALKHVVEPLFPETIRHNGRTTSDCVVRVEMEAAATDPLLAGFLEDGKDPLWWLEGSSYPIEVLDPARVRVLVKSREVAAQWGAEPVVVSFEEGKGTVLHLLSHLYLQRSEVRNARDAQPASGYLAECVGLRTAVAESLCREIPGVDAAAMKSAFTTAGLMSGVILKQKRKLRAAGPGGPR